MAKANKKMVGVGIFTEQLFTQNNNNFVDTSEFSSAVVNINEYRKLFLFEF